MTGQIAAARLYAVTATDGPRTHTAYIGNPTGAHVAAIIRRGHGVRPLQALPVLPLPGDCRDLIGAAHDRGVIWQVSQRIGERTGAEVTDLFLRGLHADPADALHLAWHRRDGAPAELASPARDLSAARTAIAMRPAAE